MHRSSTNPDVAFEPSHRVGRRLSTPYWVYESDVHHSTKVHDACCVNCNNGKGKRMNGNTKSGRWFSFASLEEAKFAAEVRQPDRHSVCNMCLGTYRTRGYRNPR